MAKAVYKRLTYPATVEYQTVAYPIWKTAFVVDTPDELDSRLRVFRFDPSFTWIRLRDINEVWVQSSREQIMGWQATRKKGVPKKDGARSGLPPKSRKRRRGV